MDTYYQLIDKDSSAISSLWKAIHITSLAIVIGSGFITAYAFGKALEYFGNHCILFANVSFQEQNITAVHRDAVIGFHTLPGYLKPLDAVSSNWGNSELCNFCQFTPIMSMICGIIWCAFFIMCSKGGAGYVSDMMYRPWRLVYPALIFATASTTVMLVSTLQLSAGIDAFCAEFKTVFHTIECINEIDDYTLAFHPMRKAFIIRLKISVIFSYICFTGWLVQLLSLILRVLCVTDFQMIRITVTGRDKEEVIDIVDPNNEDDRASMVTISEKEEEALSTKSSVTQEEPIKQDHHKHLSFFVHPHKVADIDDEPTTESSNLTLSPEFSQKDDVPPCLLENKTIVVTSDNTKQKPKQRTVSFGPPPQEGVNNTTDKKIKEENVSLSILNARPHSLNQDTTTENVKQATLYTPRSVFDM